MGDDKKEYEKKNYRLSHQIQNAIFIRTGIVVKTHSGEFPHGNGSGRQDSVKAEKSNSRTNFKNLTLYPLLKKERELRVTLQITIFSLEKVLISAHAMNRKTNSSTI